MKVKRKVYFAIPFLVLVLIFSFTFAGCCFPSSSSNVAKQTNSYQATTEYIPKTNHVEYIVLGYSSIMNSIPPEVSVTYSNSQGGTEQMNGIVLKKTPAI